jgi:pimeloyl-ACP methyl ester carboxylesterase
MAKYPGPVLQSHGTDDQIVPYVLGRKLFKLIPGPKQFFVCPGLGHNAIEPPEYDAALKNFLTEVLADAAESKATLESNTKEL